jgi:membrane-associated protein
MDILKAVLDFIIHIDKHLVQITSQYQGWTYLILFAIIFAETGFVVTPFLPGDSLLFATGALVAGGQSGLNIYLLALLEYYLKTKAFFDKHGGKAVIFSRFMPIIRTVAPFVAGVGHMPFGRYSLYNIVGGVTWIIVFLFAGYLLGNIPFFKEHFSLIGIGIIVLSIIPAIIAAFKGGKKKPAIT